MAMFSAPDVDEASVRHGLVGVDDEVVHRLAYLPGVHLDWVQVGGEIEFAFGLGSPEDEGRVAFYELGDRGGRLDEGSSLGEGEQLPREPHGPYGRLLAVGEALLRVGVGAAEHLGELEVSHDGREEIVEVVR